MGISALESAPVLSTPDTHIFEDPTPVVDPSSIPRLSDEQVALTYEVERTVREIRAGRWKRIALQFPDHMLVDGPRVSNQLGRELAAARKTQKSATEQDLASSLATASLNEEKEEEPEKFFILGDTSYGACCVDEVAAEHVDADVVVHYGRSCLSPPSRLPVIYIFTERSLDIDSVVSAFKQTYSEKESKVILMADIPFSHHMPTLSARLKELGYSNIFATEIMHSPSSLLPNRTVPEEAKEDPEALQKYTLFHISDPPPALLLTLSSRVALMHIYSPETQSASLSNSSRSLNRRYAQLTSLSATPVFGILINTLSVKNYMHILSHVQRQIAAAGKKAYTFVVGKVNAAKVANFSEVGGWVVIGCWESSLIESKDFWRPMITPWELELALQSDAQRVWTGKWEADFQAVLDAKTDTMGHQTAAVGVDAASSGNQDDAVENEKQSNRQQVEESYDSEEESAPPEFDLRTGRYVSHSRPMQQAASATITATSLSSPPTTTNNNNNNDSSSHDSQDAPDQSTTTSTALTKRSNANSLASIGGVVSPGAEYLRSNRTWQGLGSEHLGSEEGAQHPSVGTHSSKIEEGRSGIARGYVVGKKGAEDGGSRH